jgi:hypothetical protein
VRSQAPRSAGVNGLQREQWNLIKSIFHEISAQAAEITLVFVPVGIGIL